MAGWREGRKKGGNGMVFCVRGVVLELEDLTLRGLGGRVLFRGWCGGLAGAAVS
jgi:hypothetical protein